MYKKELDLHKLWLQTNGTKGCRLNLSFKNIKGINLQGHNLTRARIIGSNLTDANLENTCFVEAELNGTFLERANMKRANLTGANMTKVDLTDAKVHYADFSRCNLKDAFLLNTDFYGANTTGVNFAGCNINDALNLNTFIPLDQPEIVLETDEPDPEKVIQREYQTESTQDYDEETKKALQELSSLIGIENIKQSINELIKYTDFRKKLIDMGLESQENGITAPHCVLYGNPGTGKTTIARLLGKIYKSIGLLNSGHVVEVNREKLVGEYVGHTAPKTKKCIDESIGGVLFIDEAYELSNKGTENDFGAESIAVLLQEMENRRGEFMVIVAGYEEEMINFIESNIGLKGRFNQYFNFPDYTPDEMTKIFEKMLHDRNRTITDDALNLIHEEFIFLWRKRDKYFSNVRTVKKYLEAILQSQAKRCMEMPKSQWNKDSLTQIIAEDIEAAIKMEVKKDFSVPINEKLLNESLQELNQLIGLESVKKEIEKLITLVSFYKEEGKDLKDLSPHTMLIGNPGTGKTEVARIIAKIYAALGILERGDLIEINRDKVVSQYVGETEKLIANYINKAMGGVLFIDEAYQLTQYGLNDPGQKVVEVLLKSMEDYLGGFIVLVAGYKEEMESFLSSNLGLKRRFGRILEFEDYNEVQLMEITKFMLRQKGYYLHEDAKNYLLSYFTDVYKNRNNSFGNAGFVRNIITESIKNADYRQAKIPKEQREEDLLNVILKEDLFLIKD